MAFKRVKINILGVDVDDISYNSAVLAIIEMAKRGNRGKYVVTVNSEFVMKARNDKKFAQILAKSDLAVADGVGVAKSKLIFGGKEQSRITGVDLLQSICKKSDGKPIRIGFLGGFDTVAEEVAVRQKKLHPGLNVVIAEPGDPTIGYDLRLKERFDEVGRVDILFVAYGMGRQEFFIERMHKILDVGVFIGVGGAFDFVAGVKKRAPKFVQNLDGEWLWRLVLEPTRIWRMRVLPIFFLLVFFEFWKTKIFTNFFKNFINNS